MNEDQNNKERRSFLKKAGKTTLAAGAVSLGGLFLDSATASDGNGAITRYGEKKQEKFEIILN